MHDVWINPLLKLKEQFFMQISPLGSVPISPSVSSDSAPQQNRDIISSPHHISPHIYHLFVPGENTQRKCVCVCVSWVSVLSSRSINQAPSPGSLTCKEEGADCCQLPAFRAAVSVYTRRSLTQQALLSLPLTRRQIISESDESVETEQQMCEVLKKNYK